MNKYQISIESKNKKSLDNFLFFFFKSLKNYNLINKNFQKNKKKKFITILKSPHVNKRAQEQFQFNLYFKTINLNLTQYLIIIAIIKKIKCNLVPDVRIKIKFLVNYNLINKSCKKIFNFNNFKLKFLNNKNYNNSSFKNFRNNKPNIKLESLKKISKFLKIIDIYGEFYLK